MILPYFNANNKFILNGNIGKAIKFLEQEQLLKTELWREFVGVFRSYCDDSDLGWRCEYWGKTMRGACLVYSVNKNKKLYSEILHTVKDLLSVEKEKKILSTYSPSMQYSGWDMWGRKYIMLGLEYFLDICKSKELRTQVINFLCRQADEICKRIGDEKNQIPITKTSIYHSCMNSISILEAFVRLYSITGKANYHSFIEYIIATGGSASENIFQNALEDIKFPFQYESAKAYEMISCFEGILEYYKITKEDKYLVMVKQFMDKLAQSDLTAIGCLGRFHEHLNNATKKQTETDDMEMQETCVTITWTKICFKMYKITGDSKYVDWIERSVYNAMLGAINYQKEDINVSLYEDLGREYLPIDSYSPLVMGKRGQMIGGAKRLESSLLYGCCACIFTAGLGIAGQLMGMETENGIVFNLYENSLLKMRTPKNQDIEFKFDCFFPFDGNIKIKLRLKELENFDILLRLPSYVDDYELKINGEKLLLEAKQGYLKINRLWKNDDTIEYNMRLKINVTNLNDKINYSYGAIVLAKDSVVQISDFSEKVLQEFTLNGKQILEKEKSKNCDIAFVLAISGLQTALIDYASSGKPWSQSEKFVTIWHNN